MPVCKLAKLLKDSHGRYILGDWKIRQHSWRSTWVADHPEGHSIEFNTLNEAIKWVSTSRQKAWGV